MLQNIRPANIETQNESAVELLVGCHERIRHFADMVRKLAHAEGAAAGEIRNAAAGAYRYFSVALPLHEADEEDSMLPRLKATGDGEVNAALDAMHRQHQGIDDLLERMLPLLTLVASDPDKLPEVQAEMCALSNALDEMFRGHLDFEEKVLFPALTADMQAEMLLEMKARRKQS